MTYQTQQSIFLRNIDDVQQQLNSHQMKIDNNMSKEGLTTKVKSEVEPPEKTEVEEKEEGRKLFWCYFQWF